jgi:hypothetical protein
MKVEQLSDLALDCIHSAARALDDRYWPAFYGEVVKGLETIRDRRAVHDPQAGRVGAAAGPHGPRCLASPENAPGPPAGTLHCQHRE